MEMEVQKILDYIMNDNNEYDKFIEACNNNNTVYIEDTISKSLFIRNNLMQFKSTNVNLNVILNYLNRLHEMFIIGINISHKNLNYEILIMIFDVMFSFEVYNYFKNNYQNKEMNVVENVIIKLNNTQIKGLLQEICSHSDIELLDILYEYINNDVYSNKLLHYIEDADILDKVIDKIGSNIMNVDKDDCNGLILISQHVDLPEDYEKLKQIIHKIILNNPTLNLEHQTNEGTTAFVEACKNDNFNMVKILMEYNVNVNSSSGELTGLMHACKQGYIKIVELLLDNPNIDIHIKNSSNYDAFNYILYKSLEKLEKNVYKMTKLFLNKNYQIDDDLLYIFKLEYPLLDLNYKNKLLNDEYIFKIVADFGLENTFKLLYDENTLTDEQLKYINSLKDGCYIDAFYDNPIVENLSFKRLI